MKRFLAVLMLGLVASAAVIGCEASARIDDDRDGTYMKKTTVTEPDGDRTTKTEVRRDN